MMIENMKQLEAGDVLIDGDATSRAKQPITCLVLDTQDDGIIVTGYTRQSKRYYYSNGKPQELLGWNDATVLEQIDEDRINESGYLV